MLFRDVDETEARGFRDKRSYVRIDLSEVLHGADWTQRKKELWERCGGRCEKVIENSPGRLVRCRSAAEDPHHIVPRSKKRDDRLINLQALCRMHHDLLDERKPKWSKETT